MKIVAAAFRWIFFVGQVCGALLVLGANPLTLELKPSSDFHVVVGMFLLVGSVFWIIPETVSLIAEYIGDCWCGVFFPNARFNKPPLSYTLTDFYCKHHRHEETVREHLRIIRHYPDQRKSYLEVIAHCRAIGATKMANQYERRFRKRFKIARSRNLSCKCSVSAADSGCDLFPD